MLVMAWGCGSVRPLDGASLAAGVVPTLSPNEGILVVRVDTDVPIAKLQISDMTALSGLAIGEHFRLLAMRAGEYRWSGLVVPAGAGEVPFRLRPDDFWEFRVEAGRVSYPGEFTIRGETRSASVSLYPLQLRNRSALALTELLERYPGLLERYPPTYTGHEVDNYLDYYAGTFLAPGKASRADPP
jgi:hypothetical protein